MFRIPTSPIKTVPTYVFVLLAHLLLLPSATYADLTNYAVLGTASQSSDWDVARYPASNANDGNTDIFLAGTSEHAISHTNTEDQAWWQVELPYTVNITQIVVYNRVDTNNANVNRLSDANVMILDEAGSEVVEARRNIGPDALNNGPNPFIFDYTGGFLGKTVKVQLTDNDMLTLREVQVFSPDNFSYDSFSPGDPSLAPSADVSTYPLILSDTYIIINVYSSCKILYLFSHCFPFSSLPSHPTQHNILYFDLIRKQYKI